MLKMQASVTQWHFITPHTRPLFLNFSTTDLWDWVMLCCGHCTVQYGMFSSIPSLLTRCQQHPSPRRSQMPLERQNRPHLRTPASDPHKFTQHSFFVNCPLELILIPGMLFHIQQANLLLFKQLLKSLFYKLQAQLCPRILKIMNIYRLLKGILHWI